LSLFQLGLPSFQCWFSALHDRQPVLKVLFADLYLDFVLSAAPVSQKYR